jgi:uncharacterized membrane protein YozB (DUF420 family)
MHILYSIYYKCIPLQMTSLKMAYKGHNMQDEHHKIPNTYLWLYVQLVGLITV